METPFFPERLVKVQRGTTIEVDGVVGR